MVEGLYFALCVLGLSITLLFHGTIAIPTQEFSDSKSSEDDRDLNSKLNAESANGNSSFVRFPSIPSLWPRTTETTPDTLDSYETETNTAWPPIPTLWPRTTETIPDTPVSNKPKTWSPIPTMWHRTTEIIPVKSNFDKRPTRNSSRPLILKLWRRSTTETTTKSSTSTKGKPNTVSSRTTGTTSYPKSKNGTTHKPDDDDDDDDDDDFWSTWSFFIGVGAAAGLVFTGGLAYWCLRRRRQYNYQTL